MKTHIRKSAPIGNRSTGRESGLTIVEMMVSMAIFILFMTAAIYANIFGMRYDELVCSKLGASEQSRRSFEILTSDIRSSKIWRIGAGNLTSFAPLPNATNMVGNAIQLCSTTDTNVWVRYYFETNGPFTRQPNGRLCRVTSAGRYTICAQYLTNSSGTSMVFSAQNYLGQQMSDYQAKYIIDTLMEFSQYQYPKTYVGPGLYYDYYRIELRTASHNAD